MKLTVGSTIEIDPDVHWGKFTSCTVVNLTMKTITLEFDDHREVYDRSHLTILHDGISWHLERMVVEH